MPLLPPKCLPCLVVSSEVHRARSFALAPCSRSTSPLDKPARQARLPARLLQVAKEIEEVVRKAKKIGKKPAVVETALVEASAVVDDHEARVGPDGSLMYNKDGSLVVGPPKVDKFEMVHAELKKAEEEKREPDFHELAASVSPGGRSEGKRKPGSRGDTALHTSCFMGNINVAEVLVQVTPAWGPRRTSTKRFPRRDHVEPTLATAPTRRAPSPSFTSHPHLARSRRGRT